MNVPDGQIWLTKDNILRYFFSGAERLYEKTSIQNESLPQKEKPKYIGEYHIGEYNIQIGTYVVTRQNACCELYGICNDFLILLKRCLPGIPKKEEIEEYNMQSFQEQLQQLSDFNCLDIYKLVDESVCQKGEIAR